MNNTKLFEIWSEGYRVTGEQGKAVYIGEAKGIDFKDACKNLKLLSTSFAKYYDEDKNTFWGCNLFDNEDQARVSFG